MLARLQQVLSLALLVALVALVAEGARHGWSGGRLALLAMLLGGHAVVLAVDFALMRALHRRVTGEALPWRVVAGAWAREIRCAAPTFLWRQPWRHRTPADTAGVPPAAASALARPAEATTRGVVLVHGFVCNRGLWRPWLQRLERQGTPFAAVSLQPVFGSIDDYVPLVEDAVRRVERATGRAPIVVAHSMGGLAVRAWLRAHQADDRVEAVITIGTPHQGTWLAGASFFGVNARQMRRDSDWLRALAADEPAHRATRFLCWWSECDQIVLPVPTAVLPGSEARRLPGMAHVEMALAPAVWHDLQRRLAAP